jgi:hypothetical protein
MNAFYCESCDSVIVKEGRSEDEKPTSHQHPHGDRWYPLFYMGWFHPDFKVCEIEWEVRDRVESFGVISGVL